MAVKMTVALRNARLNAISDALGAGPLLYLYSGSPPPSANDAPTGVLLATGALSPGPFDPASGGTMSKSTSAMFATGVVAGIAGYFRFTPSVGTPIMIQGTISMTGGGGDMEIDNNDIADTQYVLVTSLVITEANA